MDMANITMNATTFTIIPIKETNLIQFNSIVPQHVLNRTEVEVLEVLVFDVFADPVNVLLESADLESVCASAIETTECDPPTTLPSVCFDLIDNADESSVETD